MHLFLWNPDIHMDVQWNLPIIRCNIMNFSYDTFSGYTGLFLNFYWFMSVDDQIEKQKMKKMKISIEVEIFPRQSAKEDLTIRDFTIVFVGFQFIPLYRAYK